jgi:hypothetical protein
MLVWPSLEQLPSTLPELFIDENEPEAAAAAGCSDGSGDLGSEMGQSKVPD